MKLLFIGDCHFKVSNLRNAIDFLDWITKLIVDVNPDVVVNLGDTWDTHAVIRSEIACEFMKHVYAVTEQGIEYIYLLGNHDMFRPNDAKYHAMLPYKDKIPLLEVVDQITERHEITFVPYQHDVSKFPLNTNKICVAHQTFKGADYGDITVQEGVDADAVSAEIIISGHIHKRQALGKVVYPGSPFAQNVNDINQIKGVMLFDTETYQYELIQSPLPMWKGARFELSAVFSCDDVHDELDTCLNDKDHWVVEIVGPKAEIVGYLDSSKCKDLFLGKDIRIKTVFTDKEKKLASIKSLSVESIVNEYIDKVYSGALDKDELKSKSVELLDKLNYK